MFVVTSGSVSSSNLVVAGINDDDLIISLIVVGFCINGRLLLVDGFPDDNNSS